MKQVKILEVTNVYHHVHNIMIQIINVSNNVILQHIISLINMVYNVNQLVIKK